MPDLWMNVDAALTEVPVNVLPLIDDTDFKTIETSIAYTGSGVDLEWNFVTCAGAFSQTAVTPTSGGDYDWSNQGNGIYAVEIPASGGASINNDTEGFGWFSGKATGVLPWRGPIIGFRAAALNDALVDGGDYLDVNVVQMAGTGQTAGDIAADLDVLLSRVSANVALASVCTETRLSELEASTAGKMANQIDLIYADTNELQANQGNWLTATGFATPANVADAHSSTDALLAAAQADLDTITDTGVTVAAITASAVDTIWATALSDLAAIPAATASVLDAINFMFELVRNQLVTDGSNSELVLYKDNSSDKLGEADISDNGTLFTREKWGAAD